MPSRPAASRLPLVLATAFLLTAAGCTYESTSGDTTTFGFLWWTPLAALAVGGALIGAGWLCRANERLAIGLWLAGGFVVLFQAPSYFFESIKVSPERFVVRGGMFGLMTYQNLKYDDLTTIRVTSKIVGGGRTRARRVYALECQLKSYEEVVHIPLSPDVGEEAAPLIFLHAQQHGVYVIDETKRTIPGVNF